MYQPRFSPPNHAQAEARRRVEELARATQAYLQNLRRQRRTDSKRGPTVEKTGSEQGEGAPVDHILGFLTTSDRSPVPEYASPETASAPFIPDVEPIFDAADEEIEAAIIETNTAEPVVVEQFSKEESSDLSDLPRTSGLTDAVQALLVAPVEMGDESPSPSPKMPPQTGSLAAAMLLNGGADLLMPDLDQIERAVRAMTWDETAQEPEDGIVQMEDPAASAEPIPEYETKTAAEFEGDFSSPVYTESVLQEFAGDETSLEPPDNTPPVESLDLTPTEDELVAALVEPPVPPRRAGPPAWDQRACGAELVDTDLTQVGGIGGGMIQRLARIGLTRVSELAAADPDLLRQRLGDVARLANVDAWIERANRLIDQSLATETHQ